MSAAFALALLSVSGPFASAARVRAIAEETPLRDLTWDYFIDGRGMAKKKTDIGGTSYLCCCRLTDEQLECKLNDMTRSVARGSVGQCKTHQGVGWASWYNAGKTSGTPWNIFGERPVGNGSCIVAEKDLPDDVRTRTTMTTMTPTVGTSTVEPIAPTTTKFGSMNMATTTPFEDMQVVDMPRKGSSHDAFTIVDGKRFKCCCHSDVTSNVKASKRIECELFNVEKGSSDRARKWLKRYQVACKQMAAKRYGVGDGWHASNNMGFKYRGLPYFGQCALRQ